MVPIGVRRLPSGNGISRTVRTERICRMGRVGVHVRLRCCLACGFACVAREVFLNAVGSKSVPLLLSPFERSLCRVPEHRRAFLAYSPVAFIIMSYRHTRSNPAVKRDAPSARPLLLRYAS